jgi:toxin FitB
VTAADAFRAIATAVRAAGRDIDTADALIAAIARARNAAVATRNRKHFVGLGLRLIDPWAVEHKTDEPTENGRGTPDAIK